MWPGKSGSSLIDSEEVTRSNIASLIGVDWVIPMHNRDLKAGTLHGLIDDMGLTREEFVSLL